MAKRGNDNTDQPKKKPGTNSPAQAKTPATKPVTTNRAPKKKIPAVAKASEPASNKPEHYLTEDKMDVLHHPQLDHKPKPWKEYLLEGFMIFIAVMMGFIAENIREDITNHQHATQLTTRLVHDIKADTAQINNIINEETKIDKCNDTLISILQQPLAKIDTKKIQRLIYDSHSLWLFYPTNGSINAIKNELQLKQFSNSDIIAYIANYERLYNLLHTDQDITLLYQRTYIDPFMTEHFTPVNLNAIFSNLPPKDTQMRNLTQDDLTHLASSMVLIKTNTYDIVRDNEALKDEAIKLLHYVIDTYHPDEK